MATILPASPSIDDEFVVGGKLFVWTGSTWKQSATYAIIDAGYSDAEVSGAINTADGGDA
jgi:hypothetical protein